MSIPTIAAVLLSSSLVLAPPLMAQEHAHTPGMTHPTAAPLPTQGGHAAFAAISEIVAMLQADASTDWSKVNIERLRLHLVDMDLVTLRSRVAATPVTGGAQFVVVFDDAVVHQANAAFALARFHAGAGAEMRMGVVHRRCAVGGPAGVGNARRALQTTRGCIDLRHQLSHPLGAARPLQTRRLAHLALRRIDRHATGVITPVLQALQALDQDGNNIAARNRTDDAAHGLSPVGDGTLSPSRRNKRFIYPFNCT